MQLRKNQASTPQQVVVKMRDSLMEPALRLKHSLQEPLLKASTPVVTASGTPSLHLQPTGPKGMSTTIHIKHTSRKAAGGATASSSSLVQAPLGPFGTARRIVQREGFLALYKGLTAVWMGIVPKMAIRFVSFEQYKEMFRSNSYTSGNMNPTLITFTAGLLSGLTEAGMCKKPERSDSDI
jgi:hypothetical protein